MKRSTLLNVLFFICLSMPMIGCDSDDGTAEDMGESVDEAAEKLKESGEDLGDRIEDTCEEATDENC